MKISKSRIRTCTGCREQDSPSNMLRIVKVEVSGAQPTESAELRFDPSKSAAGRGAWVHQEAKCLNLALTRGGLRRSFKMPVETSQLTAEIEKLQ